MSLIYADEQGTRVNLVNLTSKIESVCAGLADNNESISSQALEVTMLLECIDQYRDYKSVLLSYQESAPTAKHRFVKALERCVDATSNRADMVKLFEHCCKILDALDYGNDFAGSIKYNECKEYIEATLPEDFGKRCEWKRVVDVFAKAMVQGLFEKAEYKQGKGLRCTRKMTKVLFAYLCGRLFCDDFINYDYKPATWDKYYCENMPDQLITMYFGVTRLSQTRDKQIKERLGKLPQGYKIVEALLAEPDR